MSISYTFALSRYFVDVLTYTSGVQLFEIATEMV